MLKNIFTSIVENPFATEGEDYWGLDIDVEGNETRDYKLAARFAKKLSMKGNGERAKEVCADKEVADSCRQLQGK